MFEVGDRVRIKGEDIFDALYEIDGQTGIIVKRDTTICLIKLDNPKMPTFHWSPTMNYRSNKSDLYHTTFNKLEPTGYKPTKIYLASSFFSNGGFQETKELANAIRDKFGYKVDLYVPQENGDINDKENDTNYVTAEMISDGDNKYLEEADILLANLDGSEIDSGVSAEIGYVAGWNRLCSVFKTKGIIGYTTDMRINRTSLGVLEDIIDNYNDGNEERALDIIDNLKVNNMYKNLYTVGLVKTWGEYIVADNNTYIDKVLDVLDNYIN